jgi:hypothetical protein
MAFCPNCGTNVTEQASQCVSCGQAIGTKTKGLRFKGTMMAVGGKLPAATSPNPPSTATKPAATPLPPPAAAQPPARIGRNTAPGVGAPDVASATPAHPPVEAIAAKVLPAKTPAPSRLGAAAPPPKRAGGSPAPIIRPDSEGAAPPPRRPGTSGAPIVRTDAATAGNARALAGDPSRDARAAAARKPEARFRAGSVPPPLPEGNGRLIAISVGGVTLIAAAGYAVAVYLGLLH